MLVGLAVRHFRINTRRITILAVMCFVVAAAWMVLGYYVTEVFMYDQKAALAEVPANLIQGGGSVVLATIMLPVFSRMIPDSGSRAS
jgi:uncharacterized membrane protein